MTSQRKIAANRRNARRSTGPRTLTGKARSSRNALRHGLTIKTTLSDYPAGEIRELFEALRLEFPRVPPFLIQNLIEAEIDALRARSARRYLWNSKAKTKSTADKNLASISQSSKTSAAAKRTIRRDIITTIEKNPDALLTQTQYENLTNLLIWSSLRDEPQDRVRAPRQLNLQQRFAILGRYEDQALGRRRRSIRAMQNFMF